MKPTIGRIVRVTLDDGCERPAVVVEVWSPTTVNLRAFFDGLNDTDATLRPDRKFRGAALTSDWLTSVEQAETATPGKWHWPPREGAS